MAAQEPAQSDPQSGVQFGSQPEPASGIVMFWRPGCGFCAALERQLVRSEMSFEKRNIWEDDEARAFVRSVARGNETVPTLVVNGTPMVNPSLEQVRAALV